MVSHRFYQPCKVITADREVEDLLDFDEIIVELDVLAMRAIRAHLEMAQC